MQIDGREIGPSLILPELVSGRVVEGQTCGRFDQNERHDCANVVQHITRGNAQRINPGVREIAIARRIPRRTIAARMGLAVYLDCKPRTAVEKVEDVRAAGVLATEFEAARPCSKHLPKQHFRRAHGAAQLASAWDAASACCWRDVLEQRLSPPSVLRTATSPRQARGGTRRPA